MSKIVCDVCGTSYPETATQCPICGCVRPSDNVVPIADVQETEPTRHEGYTYVKGGRFSKSNVRKKTAGEPVERDHAEADSSEPDRQKDIKADKGLVFAVCMLLLAIVAVVIYIVVHFFGSQSNAEQDPSTTTTPNNPSTSATTTATEADLSCTLIVLSNTEIELEIGATHQLTATLTPENTTDTLAFKSDNESVATVSADGQVSAVSAGDATVTVTCGQMTATCKVVCKAPAVPTDPSSPTQATEPSQPTQVTENYVAPFRLNKRTSEDPKHGDVSITVGESFTLKLLDYNGKVVPVTWTVEDSSVCSVNGNTVTGSAVGRTTVSVTYEDEIYTCTIRVRAGS